MAEQDAGQAEAQGAEDQVQTAEQDSAQQQSTELDTEALQAELKKVRGEAAQYRTKSRDTSQQNEQLQARLNAISQALGLETETDPSQELERLSGDLRMARLENAFHREAAGAGADANLTWAYLYANGALDGIDTNGDAKAMRTAMREQIDAALQANAKLRADTAATRSSVDNAAPQNGNGQRPERDMNTLLRTGLRRG